ncbi:MAG: hypothetical protein QOE90_1487 [Thermoplasmata archaeon]|jgi:hypothetical protein|nr:hypothetical protein [Thermoplasmata archaeon]
MTRLRSLALLLLAVAVVGSGCVLDPKNKVGPLQPHGRLDFGPNDTVTTHVDFYNAGDLPVRFPPRAFDKNEKVADPSIDTLVVPGDGSNQSINGIIVDGPLGNGLGKGFLFNASDVIAPHAWRNTTFHIRFDHHPAPSWQYRFSVTVTYYTGNDTVARHWLYDLPCYNGFGALDASIEGCDEIFGAHWLG